MLLGGLGSCSCQKDLSCYQMGFCCCKRRGILQEKLDTLSKCYVINGSTILVGGGEDFLGSIWNSAASQRRPFRSLAGSLETPPSFLPWQRTFSSPINFIYTLFLSKEILNFPPPQRDYHQPNLLNSFQCFQESILTSVLCWDRGGGDRGEQAWLQFSLISG